MSWCHCEDYPCCGHDAGMGPESAEDFLEGLDGEEYEFAVRTMTPCPSCGEMRPKDDRALRDYGVCNMCHEDPVRSQSPVAGNNMAYHTRHKDSRIRELETLLRKNGIEVPHESEEDECW